MAHFQGCRVERLPCHAVLRVPRLGMRRVVGWVRQDRDPLVGEVESYLVGPPGPRPRLDPAHPGVPGKHSAPSERLEAPGRDLLEVRRLSCSTWGRC